MSRMLKLRGRCAALNTAVAMLLGLVQPGYGQSHCLRPDSPCPCAADGMCYPRRDTWGNYKTQWHAWPGDSVGLTPTPVEGTLPGESDQLQPYIRPRLDQEDLRGPARPPRATTPAAGAAPAADGGVPGANAPAAAQPAVGAPVQEQEAAPPANDGLQLPGLPGFGPQGNLKALPRLEDGPPALPQGLSQALAMQPAAAPTVAKQPTASAVPTTSRFITPTAAYDTSRLELSNPAAKNVQKSMDQDLQQAIYFEASDMPTDK